MKLRILALSAVAVMLTLPGCIVGEIRDEMRNANTQLAQVQVALAKLDQTNEQIATTHQELTRTALLISQVHDGLTRIDTTNSSLSQVDQRLALLNSINTSLNHLDTHLASLRKTISRLDGVIPFLDLGGGDEPELPEAVATADAAPAAEGETATPAAAAEGEAAATGPAPAAAAAAEDPAPREPMLGAWISRYPDDSMALILMADGQFILARKNLWEMTGSWKRDQRSIVLTVVPNPTPESTPVTPVTPVTPASSNPEPAAKSGTQAPPPGPAQIRLEVLMSAGRSVTVRSEGSVLILVRP